MFTGIVSNVGKILKKEKSQLTIQAGRSFVSRLTLGLSVAVNGICLTVASKFADSFTIDYIPETDQKTNLKYGQSRDLVNLELPATPVSFLSGHIVLGHVDGVAKLESIIEDKNSHILKFSILPYLAKYIVEKGPVCVNGISLTVIEAGKNQFTVGIIPHTWEQTMLHQIKIGDYANIEVDILAKYLERLSK